MLDTCNDSRVIDLEIQVEHLTQTLSTANQEVDNLTLENCNLKKEIDNCQIIIKSLRSLQSPMSERQRCLSPRPIRNMDCDKNKRQSFTKIPLKEIREIETKSIQTPKKRNTNRKIKLVTKPKNKYTNKSIFKRMRIQKKKLITIERELKDIVRERNLLQHKILELEAKKKLIKLNEESRITNEYKVKIATEKKKNKQIFSDSLGSGLAIQLAKQDGVKDVAMMNHCKPGATSRQILSSFNQHTKHLLENDIAANLIGNYCEVKMEVPYIEIIKSILTNESRKCNVVIGSIVYDGKNDFAIYELNKELFR